MFCAEGKAFNIKHETSNKNKKPPTKNKKLPTKTRNFQPKKQETSNKFYELIYGLIWTRFEIQGRNRERANVGLFKAVFGLFLKFLVSSKFLSKCCTMQRISKLFSTEISGQNLSGHDTSFSKKAAS